MALLLDQLTEQGDQMRQSEIELIRNDASLILHVRVTAGVLERHN